MFAAFALSEAVTGSHYLAFIVPPVSLYVNSPLPFALPQMYAILTSSRVRVQIGKGSGTPAIHGGACKQGGVTLEAWGASINRLLQVRPD